MPERRKRLFGPLLYSTLALSVVAVFAVIAMEALARLANAPPPMRPLDEIVADLRSDQEDVSRRALADLFRTGESTAIDVLRDEAKSSRAEMRRRACASLVLMKLDPSPFLPVLVDLADDPDAEVRAEAARALGLLPAFAKRRAYYGLRLPQVLDDSERASAVAALRTLAKDDDSVVQYEAARSWASVDPSEASGCWPVIVGLLAAPGASEWHLDLVKIFKRDRPALIGDLLSILEASLATDENIALQHAAIECLMEIRDAKEALPMLLLRETSGQPAVRAAAGLARAAIQGPGTPEALTTLTHLIADTSLPIERRQTALNTLRATNPKNLAKATPGLIRGLADPNPNTRLETLNLIQQIIEDRPAELPSIFQSP